MCPHRFALCLASPLVVTKLRPDQHHGQQFDASKVWQGWPAAREPKECTQKTKKRPQEQDVFYWMHTLPSRLSLLDHSDKVENTRNGRNVNSLDQIM